MTKFNVKFLKPCIGPLVKVLHWLYFQEGTTRIGRSDADPPVDIGMCCSLKDVSTVFS